jgi:hypothetical protein
MFTGFDGKSNFLLLASNIEFGGHPEGNIKNWNGRFEFHLSNVWFGLIIGINQFTAMDFRLAIFSH